MKLQKIKELINDFLFEKFNFYLILKIGTYSSKHKVQFMTTNLLYLKLDLFFSCGNCWKNLTYAPFNYYFVLNPMNINPTKKI